MKFMNLTFENKDFKKLAKLKDKLNCLSWEAFILMLARAYKKHN